MKKESRGKKGEKRMKELEYLFDCDYILSKKRSLKKKLYKQIEKEHRSVMKKKIAILGGSTTSAIKEILELFLLDHGIKPAFYESEYNQYFQDAMFGNPELETFAPDVIYLHTSNRNITDWPQLKDTEEQIEQKLEQAYYSFESIWERLKHVYHCVLIQNNMELPPYRILGNKEVSDLHGRIHFVNCLNEKFYAYARANKNFYINDIQYLSACYGLDQWLDPFYWHMYKYALCVPAIPLLAKNVANIIKSVYGKNKKAFVLDLDHTLWGGVVGDDGPEQLELGQETPVGQAYSEFQAYIKAHKEMGVLLNVCSKNEEENALAGLNHPDGILKPEDFIVIKANWNPKSQNIAETADELSLLPESLVFVDDNPAEREIVRQQLGEVAVPELSTIEHYIREVDRQGYFEVTNLSEDDLKRNQMYKVNAERAKIKASFENYKDYLLSLQMYAVIKPFEAVYLSRIAQLTNKSNQFNLTTKRYSQAEIEAAAADTSRVTLYGKLTDRFGDNGVVSVVIGRIEQEICHIELWLMSCRVLKRDMEFAMMDRLAEVCKKRGIHQLQGYYYPTAKNGMVKNFYELQGFTKVEEDAEGNSIWSYLIEEVYQNKNHVIEVEKEVV